MVFLRKQCLVFLGLWAIANGRPQASQKPTLASSQEPTKASQEPTKMSDPPESSWIPLPEDIPTSTITLSISAQPTGPPPEFLAQAEPIDANRYWWVDQRCHGDANFIKVAYADARKLAINAMDWPEKFETSNELYVGKGFSKSKHEDQFWENFRSLAIWDTGDTFFGQAYITVTCHDPYKVCGNQLSGQDGYPVGYVNNTVSWFWGTYWEINMCPPFFKLNTLSEIYEQEKDKPKESLQLQYMYSSAAAFLHEAMHVLAITDPREHIIDQTFDGGRRIYGAERVAKAARMAPADGFALNYKNADTYACFAQAAYWEKTLGVCPIPAKKEPREGQVPFVMVSDSSTNYVQNEYVLAPKNGGGQGGQGGQQIALASYIHPLADPDAWSRMLSYDKSKVSVLVANIMNGPDTTTNNDWAKVINQAVASGKRVIGYVRTGYLGVSHQKFKTRLGSIDLADWVAQIERDVDLWYKLYPGKIGGIFFDEGWNSCGDGNMYAELYRQINENTKRKYPGAYTVLNPGDFMPKCFEHSADTLLTFESSYERYIDNAIYKPNGWTTSNLQKNWHIIYNVPKSEIGRIAKLAKERGAGFIQITNDIMPNPYDNLPKEEYMQEHINAVDGGVPFVADPLPRPKGTTPARVENLKIVAFDYTSAELKWPAVAGATEYQITVNDGPDYVSFPGSMTRATIGELQPASPYTFAVIAVGADGSKASPSASLTITTKPLPGGKTILDVKATASAGSTEYEANILMPYAFIRLYIWDKDTACDWNSNPGWPVNFAQANYVCTHYMVEGDVLYKFTGKVPAGTTNVPWAWTEVPGTVTSSQTGYTYKWTIPIGTSTTDTTKFVVQVEGYAPRGNVFKPCPTEGGGPVDSYGYCR